MLTCHACMKRCLQTIIGDSNQLTTPIRSLLGANTHRQWKRDYTSQSVPETVSWQNVSHRDGEPSSVDKSPDRSRLHREEWFKSRGVRPEGHVPTKKSQIPTSSSMKKHLVYLKDPLKLAEYIQKILGQDDFETAQELVRTASKNIQCTVSWNHLVDWQLTKGRMNAAIKTYNEMKKRAQNPDAHTYTIIFRGCSEHRDSAQALAKVLAMYHSMRADNAPIKPNTIHTNAVLKMCAKAHNMDALFGISGQMPSQGVGGPNNLTFTTIFNALRVSALSDMRTSLTPMQKRQNIQNAILQARHMWQDVVQMWRKGDLWIDEELVCSMGRLLVIGSETDLDDIPSLIEQTMNIPRQVPRIGTQSRRGIDPSSQGKSQLNGAMISEPRNECQKLNSPATTDVDKSVLVQESSTVEKESKKTPNSEPPSTTEDAHNLTSLHPFGSKRSPKAQLNAYARPGQNSLSLILLAMLEQKLMHPATKYWDIFTKEKGVMPDGENYNAYLRILRVARASTQTVHVLSEMPRSGMKVGTFRIAMATCRRDKNNPHSFANAGKVLDILQSAFPHPDVKVLEEYLAIALTSPATSSEGSSQPSREAQGKQILRAISRLGPSVINIRHVLSWEYYDDNTSPSSEKIEYVRSVLSFTRSVVGAYDQLMDKGLVPREQYRELHQERNKLAAFITRSTKTRWKLMTNPLSAYTQISSQAKESFRDGKDPEFRRRFDEAKKTAKTWEAFLQEAQASKPPRGDKLARDAWLMHANTESRSAIQSLEEDERQGAEVEVKEFQTNQD